LNLWRELLASCKEGFSWPILSVSTSCRNKGNKQQNYIKIESKWQEFNKFGALHVTCHCQNCFFSLSWTLSATSWARAPQCRN
jgi:hypothetical protein